MNFVDEQYVIGLKVGQHRRQIPCALQHRPGSVFEIHTHFTGDDVCQRGLAQTWRAEQQCVVKWLFTGARGLDKNGELFADFLLSYVFL